MRVETRPSPGAKSTKKGKKKSKVMKQQQVDLQNIPTLVRSEVTGSIGGRRAEVTSDSKAATPPVVRSSAAFSTGTEKNVTPLSFCEAVTPSEDIFYISITARNRNSRSTERIKKQTKRNAMKQKKSQNLYMSAVPMEIKSKRESGAVLQIGGENKEINCESTSLLKENFQDLQGKRMASLSGESSSFDHREHAMSEKAKATKNFESTIFGEDREPSKRGLGQLKKKCCGISGKHNIRLPGSDIIGNETFIDYQDDIMVDSTRNDPTVLNDLFKQLNEANIKIKNLEAVEKENISLKETLRKNQDLAKSQLETSERNYDTVNMLVSDLNTNVKYLRKLTTEATIAMVNARLPTERKRDKDIPMFVEVDPYSKQHVVPWNENLKCVFNPAEGIQWLAQKRNEENDEAKKQIECLEEKLKLSKKNQESVTNENTILVSKLEMNERKREGVTKELDNLEVKFQAIKEIMKCVC